MENRSPYKTAEELQIQPWEHDALVALVGPLSRGELDEEFSMTNSCGSVCCIGGHVGISSGKYNRFQRSDDGKAFVVDYVCGHASRALRALYFPTESRKLKPHPAWNATGPQAARAVVDFLVTGAPSWDAVMAEAA